MIRILSLLQLVLIVPLIAALDLLQGPLSWLHPEFYFRTAHTEWGLSLCFIGLVVCYYIINILEKGNVSGEEFIQKIGRVLFLISIVLTAKYPLLATSGVIQKPTILFLFHVVDTFIIGVAFILGFPLYILYHLMSKRPFYRRSNSEDKELAALVLFLLVMFAGVGNILTAWGGLDIYFKYTKGMGLP